MRCLLLRLLTSSVVKQSCGDMAMTQHLLDSAYINSFIQQMGGRRPSNIMRAKQRNPCFLCPFLKKFSQRPPIQSVLRYLPTLTDGHEYGFTNPPGSRKPSFQHGLSFPNHIGQPNLIPLALTVRVPSA